MKCSMLVAASMLALCNGTPAAAQSVPEARSVEADTSDRASDDSFVGEAEAIVVTGTRTERLQREAPVRTDVIGDTVLRLAAPRNLADALEYLPGARAESNCQNCNTTEIQLLGLPGVYNQILFDGLPLVSGAAAVYGVEQFPTVLIDRIEVVKGAALFMGASSAPATGPPNGFRAR